MPNDGNASGRRTIRKRLETGERDMHPIIIARTNTIHFGASNPHDASSDRFVRHVPARRPFAPDTPGREKTIRKATIIRRYFLSLTHDPDTNRIHARIHMLIDDIALTMHPEIGSKTAIHLLEHFGSAEALFAATEEEIVERTQLKASLARSLCRREFHERAAEEMAFVERHRIRAVCSTSDEYPRRLKECPDYPHVLYVSGGTDLNTAHWLSVVGTRRITPYGSRLCERLVGEIAERWPDTVVVSGLAYGVDIAAHRAAMNAGLKTVGVVAHPLTRIYPSRHTESARRMVHEGGAVVSEFHSGCRCDKTSFVRRNRIIAGLSEGTLIVESAAKGGSLITADMADGYHRTVMALPGRVGDPCSEGTNALIKNLKAQMVCSGQDIADALGWTASAPRKTADGADDTAATSLTPAQHRILRLIGTDAPVSLEELGLRGELSLQELSGILLELEFSGAVRSLPGNLYIR